MLAIDICSQAVFYFDILERHVQLHVLKPLQDLIADTLHPVTGVSYGALWQHMVDKAPRLEIVELDFD